MKKFVLFVLMFIMTMSNSVCFATFSHQQEEVINSVAYDIGSVSGFCVGICNGLEKAFNQNRDLQTHMDKTKNWNPGIFDNQFAKLRETKVKINNNRNLMSAEMYEDYIEICNVLEMDLTGIRSLMLEQLKSRVITINDMKNIYALQNLAIDSNVLVAIRAYYDNKNIECDFDDLKMSYASFCEITKEMKYFEIVEKNYVPGNEISTDIVNNSVISVYQWKCQNGKTIKINFVNNRVDTKQIY